jgi:hypothetical protein
MICPVCLKEITPEVLSNCRVPKCPNTTPVNTSGKVNQLFRVDGNGFEVENINLNETLGDLYFPS